MVMPPPPPPKKKKRCYAVANGIGRAETLSFALITFFLLVENVIGGLLQIWMSTAKLLKDKIFVFA